MGGGRNIRETGRKENIVEGMEMKEKKGKGISLSRKDKRGLLSFESGIPV